jgi:hypothetical protein
MIKNISYFAVLLVLHTGYGQSAKEDLIHWHPDRKLTWADYKGKVQEGSDAAASTATYLGIEYNFGRDGFDYKITCSFSKTKSWGLHKTDYILTHEQGHFDIAEIFARKLNKQMGEYKFNPASFKDDLRNIYQSLMAEKDAFQNLYDEETNHSIRKEKQAEWLGKIETLLNDYKAFSGYNH